MTATINHAEPTLGYTRFHPGLAVPPPKVDMQGKVAGFLGDGKDTLVGILARSITTIKSMFKPWTSGAAPVAAPIVAGALATDPGYQLAVGAVDLGASTGRKVVNDSIHGFNRVFTPVMLLGALGCRAFGKKAMNDALETVREISGDIAGFAETVDAGMHYGIDRGVEVLAAPTTAQVVRTGSAVIATGLVTDALTRGWLTRMVERIPTVGGYVAPVFKGGKATWIALGGLVVVGVSLTVGLALGKQSEEGAVADGQEPVEQPSLPFEEDVPVRVPLSQRLNAWAAQFAFPKREGALEAAEPAVEATA